MKDRRLNQLLMIISFLTFLIGYSLTSNQYSSIVGLGYIVLITIQVLIYFNNIIENKLRWLLLLLFVAIMILSIVNISDTTLSAFLLCSIIVFMGHLCCYIPYNPFVGIRIFSTRNDEGNWKATHHLLANLSIPISCLILFLSIFLKANMSATVTIAFTIWLLVPIVYSIWIYPKRRF